MFRFRQGRSSSAEQDMTEEWEERSASEKERTKRQHIITCTVGRPSSAEEDASGRLRYLQRQEGSVSALVRALGLELISIKLISIKLRRVAQLVPGLRNNE